MRKELPVRKKSNTRKKSSLETGSCFDQSTLFEWIGGRSGAGQFFCQPPVGCQIPDNYCDNQEEKGSNGR